jgi:GNAT superfamily N-acetyltransferase
VVSVREAQVEDAEAVVRVHEQASAASFEELVGRRFAEVFPLDERLGECRDRLAARSAREGMLVAELDGAVVGMAFWSVDEGARGELEDLHVVPAAWGTGAARALLDAAVAALHDAGATATLLWVGEANGRARRFYEREGWSYDGTSRASLLGPTELLYRLTGEPPAPAA